MMRDKIGVSTLVHSEAPVATGTQTPFPSTSGHAWTGEIAALEPCPCSRLSYYESVGLYHGRTTGAPWMDIPEERRRVGVNAIDAEKNIMNGQRGRRKEHKKSRRRRRMMVLNQKADFYRITNLNYAVLYRRSRDARSQSRRE